MNIALLVTQLEPGGAQKAALTLARGLMARGHSATLFVFYEKVPCLERFGQEYGVPIVSLEMKRNQGASVALLIKGAVRFRRLLRRGNYDLLQTFTHYSNIVGPWFAALSGVRCCVVSQRNSMANKARWIGMLERWICNSRLVKHATAVSKHTMEYSVTKQGIRNRKISVIPNSVEVETYAVADPHDAVVEHEMQQMAGGRFRIICVGRLHAQKGHEYLLSALASIVKVHPDVCLFLAGGGALRSELEQRVEQLHLTANVFFLGERSDIPSLLRACHLFVLPSLYEGMPNVVLEAMAARIPVLATAVDGTKELVDAGVDGVLVPPAQVDQLEQEMYRMIVDSSAVLVDRAAEKVRSAYSVRANVDAYENLYRGIVRSTDENQGVS